jgi:hypothetical protein
MFSSLFAPYSPELTRRAAATGMIISAHLGYHRKHLHVNELLRIHPADWHLCCCPTTTGDAKAHTAN